ncbi:hypothetical protein [Paenimyroides aestuarii]|uniref:Uncharacterized protein n=1 Tax=Paenimyroides aestuarii TaxID=2968490 RepID=A0ABY5NUJ7_9FLAO|nr:hypothetical protein [Paenimyroides aestuarii]UUV22266.1 hypothetical protein NPX36_04305 [Paenimyroides aestuarii]
MYKAKKIHIALTFALLFSAKGLYAQQGFGTNEPSKASVIDMQSETKGLLIPRVQLASLTDFLPVKGETATNVDKTNSLLVYNTATVGTTITPGYYYWTTDGTAINSFWKRLLANNDASALALAGDVTGTLGANVVEKIQGIPVATTAPNNNQVLTYNGTAWTPAAITPSVISNKADLSVTDGIRIASGSGTGALLNAATVGINDKGIAPIKITPGTNGQVLTTNGSGNAVWSALPSSVSSLSVTAPITNSGTSTAPNIGISRNSLTTASSNGSATNAVVITNGSNAVVNGTDTSLQVNNTAALWNANQLRGQNISATTPTNAQVLQYNGGSWTPASLPAATVTTANNGLNLNGTTVELGGNLNKATTITQNANPLTIATGGTALTISGLPTGVTADKALVATATGVVKQVRQAPRFFYMPAVIFDTSANGTNLTRNLYDEYVKQFQGGQAGAGSTTYNIAHGAAGYSMPYNGGIVASTGAPADIPVYGSNELYYYITYYDTAVFSNLSINASGELTYSIISNASNVSYMNIVFVVRE